MECRSALRTFTNNSNTKIQQKYRKNVEKNCRKILFWLFFLQKNACGKNLSGISIYTTASGL